MKKVLYILLLGLLYLISLLPFWILYMIADFLYVMLYYVTGYRRKIVDQNLLNSFPEKSTQQRDLIRKKYYHYLADLIVETIKTLTISEKELIKRVRPVNEDVISEAFENRQSVLGVLGHYGNWEMNALRFSQLISERRIIVYKTLSNGFFNQFLLRMRSRFGADLITMKNIARKLVEYRNERTATVLVADQTPAKSEIVYFADFLNQPTPVFLGVEKLAKLTNSVLVFCDIRIEKRGYYKCTFVPLFTEPKATAPYEITDRHVQYLEQVIREQPEYWLWSHRRWKFKPGDLQLHANKQYEAVV